MRALAQDEEHLRLLRALDPKSIITVPLFAHGKLVGAMALISATSGRVYELNDVRFAEDVAQRAAFAIENAQLYAEARQAIQTRDDVLGIVAHDLRNPLASILMQVELLRRCELAPEQPKKSADVIERSATRMQRLIHDLLDVVRLEKGRLSVEQLRIPVLETVSDAVEVQQQLAMATSLQLQVEIAPQLPDVFADRDRLLQIFENLIGNAIKFTGPGGTIRVGAQSTDGDVLFWVADTGTGISSENLPHVFDPFWQARKGGRYGAGLGLPIVKGLVEAHGGRVWVDSTIGRGTTFYFTLPSASRPSRTGDSQVPRCP
jgi:signal transduction histidine kinase